MPKRLKIENQYDYGRIHRKREGFGHLLFVHCGLSLHPRPRSTFVECEFIDIRSDKGVVGFPIFERCRFRDIVEKDLLTLYGAAFVECTVSGEIHNMNFGIRASAEHLHDPNLQRTIDAENMAYYSRGKFALDFREAELGDVGFIGEAIVPFLRFRRGQAIIWKGDRLQEKLWRLGRATPRGSDLGTLYLGGAPADPADRIGVAAVPESLRSSLHAIEAQLANEGISVTHFP